MSLPVPAGICRQKNEFSGFRRWRHQPHGCHLFVPSNMFSPHACEHSLTSLERELVLPGVQRGSFGCASQIQTLFAEIKSLPGESAAASSAAELRGSSGLGSFLPMERKF